MNFKELHQQDKPLLIGNVWDVPSTKIAEQLNFQAIGTSSSAIARLLGYNDGEEISFSELEYIIKRITLNTHLPLSVDLEAGYSRNPKTIVEHIKRLSNLGIVGINLEDSIVSQKRVLLSSDDFTNILSKIKTYLVKENLDTFVNIRTDTFILLQNDKLAETQRRIQVYQEAGADGIFVPCIEKEEDIKTIVASTSLPLNVMCMPKLPNFNTLTKLGVKRISMGNFMFDNMYNWFEQTAKNILKQQSFNSIF